MLRRAKDVVGQRDELVGAHGKPRFLERLPFGTRKVALADLEVAAGELPLAYAASVSVSFGSHHRMVSGSGNRRLKQNAG